MLLRFALVASAISVVAAAQAPHDRLTDAGARAQAALDRMIAAGGAPGAAAAVSLDGTIVWSGASGFADLASKTPATPQTRFGIGSISKTMTTAAALKLAERGLFDLDAPVERYLPGFPHAGRGLTARHILTHQSGLSDATARTLYHTTEHFATLEAAYERMQSDPLEFAPGSKLLYGTGTFTVLGRALERAEGRPYLEIMQREVFGPAEMTSIVPNDPRKPPANRTTFYSGGEGGGVDVAPVYDPSHKLPGAGFLATAIDVARFGAALLDPGFMPPRWRDEMFAPARLADGSATDYALGLQHGEEGGRRVRHLPGGGIGISSWLYIYPDDRLVIAILSNLNTAPVGGRVRREIAEAFLQAAACLHLDDPFSDGAPKQPQQRAVHVAGAPASPPP